jgi:hypothetical protein
MQIVRLVSISLVSGLLALGACKKDKASEEGAAGEQPAADPAEAGKPTDGPGGATEPVDPTAPDPAAPGTAATPPGERPASVTQEMADLAGRMVSHMEAIGAAAEGAGGDCAKAGKDMTAAAEKARPDMEKLEAMMGSAKDDPAAEAWFKSTFEARMHAVVPKLMTVAQQCADNPEFQKAMAAMDFMGGKR